MKGPTMAIKCGSTGHSHETVAQVRSCQLGGTAPALPAPVSTSGGSVVMDRLRRQAQQPLPFRPVEMPGTSEGAAERIRRQAVSTRYGSGSSYRSASPTINPATGKMVKYVSDLLAQREIPEAVAEPIGKAIEEGRLSFQAARLFIEAYKDAQRKASAQTAPADAPALPDVPAGRYALRTDGVVKFYVLDRPDSGRWAGHVFLKAQASDEKYPIKNLTAKVEILGRISEDIEGAQKLYGQELGRCYACGRTLTDETSRALGIGPDCRSK